ncbi:MAG: TusE/DsrC/DsvC family sulfur relay protein [Hyphomicrobiales bacterium]|nr:TusE/DsrC/DsvC family sulfur relay protein [Hyphomicrobiales bacterium]
MAYDFDGQSFETTASGYLLDQSAWTPALGEHIATAEGIALTQRHWDVIDYLREEFFDNGETQPNTRAIMKAMSEKWGEKVEQRTLYDLFPMDPSKQAGRIGGLPESRRKGGY